MELKEALEGIRHSEPGRSHAVGDQGQEMPVFERIIMPAMRCNAVVISIALVRR